MKTYLTISDNFFIQTRINPNYIPLSRLSMDLKVMPRSHKGHQYISCIIDEVTNYLITFPIYQARSEEIGEVLINNVITKYCIPEYIIMDQNSAFMSSLMTYLLAKFNIKIRTVAHYNNQSLQAEHGVKSLIHNSYKTSYQLRSDVAKIFAFGYFCVQHI